MKTADSAPTAGVMVAFEGQVMFGPLVSTTMTKNEHEVLRKYWFCAVHVTTVAPSMNTDGDAREHDTFGDTPEGSDALTLYVTVVDGAPPDGGSTWFAGHVMVGGLNALTLTTNEHVFQFSALSNAVQATDVLPMLNVDPLGMLHDAFLMPDPSVALNVYVAVAVTAGAMGFRLKLGEHETAGGTVSTTATPNTGHCA